MTGKEFVELYVRKDVASGYVMIIGDEIYHIGDKFRRALAGCKSNRQLYHFLSQRVEESKIRLDIKPMWKSWHHKVHKQRTKKRYNEQANKNCRRDFRRTERPRN